MHLRAASFAFLVFVAFAATEKEAGATAARSIAGAAFRKRVSSVSFAIGKTCVDVSSEISVEQANFAFVAGPNKTAVVLYSFRPNIDVWVEDPHRVWSLEELKRIGDKVTEKLEGDLGYTVTHLREGDQEAEADELQVYQSSIANSTDVIYIASFRVSWDNKS
jgi:hypothetical protein